MYSVAAALDPDSYLELARASYGEMVLSGVTAVGEFHYVHHGRGGTPYDDPNAMGEALLTAATEAGLRITLLDTCYLHGGISIQPDDVQRRFADGDVEAWAGRVSSLAARDGARIGAAIHSVRSVDPAAVEVVAGWASAAGAPLHAHVSEQPAENEQCLAAFGRTPTAVLGDHGALSQRFTAVHATHATAADVGLLGQHRCFACLCPTTERDLADGIGPSSALVAAGARLTLGSDSHAIVDLFEEARAVELDERLRTGRRGTHSPGTLLAAATTEGHISLGWPEAGRLAAGALADFMTIRLDSVRLAGTTAADAVAAVVFAGAATDVHHLVMGGEVVVAEGRHRRLDVAAELARAIGALHR
jgi:formiminoglutamate deiminase